MEMVVRSSANPNQRYLDCYRDSINTKLPITAQLCYTMTRLYKLHVKSF